MNGGRKFAENSLAVVAWLMILAFIIFNNLAIWPMYDEWVYTVHSAWEILPQVWHEYFVWNGRIVNTIGARVYSLLPLGVVEAIICAGWLLYLSLIGYLAWGHQFREAIVKWYAPLLLWVVALFFILDLWFTSTWHTGTTSYLWTANIVMAFFAVFRHHLADSQETLRTWSPSRRQLLWLAPLALLAGWSNYNIGPTVFAVFAGFIFWKRKEIKPMWPMLLLLGLMGLGALLMNLAPGNMVRASQEGGEKLSFIPSVVRNAFQLQFLTADYAPAFVLMIIGGVLRWKRHKWQRQDTRVMVLAFSCAALATLAYLPSPLIPTRYSFHFIGTMYAIAAVRLFTPYLQEGRGRWVWRSLLLVVCILPALRSLLHWQDFRESYRSMEQSFAFVKSHQNSGCELIIPRQYIYPSLPWGELTNYKGARQIGALLMPLPLQCSGFGVGPDAETHFNVAAARAWGVRSARSPFYQASYLAQSNGMTFSAKEFFKKEKRSLRAEISGHLPDGEIFYLHYATPHNARGVALLKALWARKHAQGIPSASAQQLQDMGYETHTVCIRQNDGEYPVVLRLTLSASWVKEPAWICLSTSGNPSQLLFVPLQVTQNASNRDYDPETGKPLNGAAPVPSTAGNTLR